LNEIKLNMNEMPYLPPQKIMEATRKGLLNLNRYANFKDLELLRELLGNYSGVSKKHIILSPGSDLLLREIIYIFSKGRKLIMVNPSFFSNCTSCKTVYKKIN